MNNLKIITFIAFLIAFVNYTILDKAYAKSNFEYSVYTPDTFQKLKSDAPHFSDGSNILFIVDYSNSMN